MRYKIVFLHYCPECGREIILDHPGAKCPHLQGVSSIDPSWKVAMVNDYCGHLQLTFTNWDGDTPVHRPAMSGQLARIVCQFRQGF